MFADVTVITLDGLHKTLLWLVIILSLITWLFWKFGGKKGRTRTATGKRPSAKPRRQRRPPVKSKFNNPHARNLTDIR